MLNKFVIFWGCLFSIITSAHGGIDDSICLSHEFPKSYQCLSEKEGTWIKPFSNRVFRNGKTLVLKSGTRKKIYTDERADSIEIGNSDILYVFRFLVTDRFAVIEKISLEGTYFILYDFIQNKEVVLDALPVFSPGKQRLAVISGKNHVPYSPEMIRIYRILPQGIKEEIQHELKALESSAQGQWTGETFFTLHKWNYERKKTDQTDPIRQTMTFTWDGGQWLMTGK